MRKNLSVWLAAALVGLAAATLPGCSGTTQYKPVTGTVTVDDKPVRSGQLTFLGGPDKAKHVTVIGFDGRYSIQLPPGDYKVGVESSGQPSAANKMMNVPPPKAPKGMAPMRDPTGQVPGEGVDAAKELQNPVAVPMKYRPPESSGLSVNVTGRGDTYDIAMKSKG